MEEPDRMDEGLRAALPMSFGRQEVKAARADALHAQTRRKEPAFGPPRPPPRAQAPPQQQQLEQGGNDGGDGDDAEMVGPPRPPPGSGSGSGDGSSSDEDDDDSDEDGAAADPYRLPVSHEVALSGFARAVTCLDVEHSGARVAAGGVDNVVRLYDFNGMRADLRPFRCGCLWGAG